MVRPAVLRCAARCPAVVPCAWPQAASTFPRRHLRLQQTPHTARCHCCCSAGPPPGFEKPSAGAAAAAAADALAGSLKVGCGSAALAGWLVPPAVLARHVPPTCRLPVGAFQVSAFTVQSLMFVCFPQVSEEPPVDDPDLSIRAERLIDDGPGEIKTVVADSTMYTSGESLCLAKVWCSCAAT